jgi:hypothetical protein
VLRGSVVDDVCPVLDAEDGIAEDAAEEDGRVEESAVSDDETLLDEELGNPQDPYCGWQPSPQKSISPPLRRALVSWIETTEPSPITSNSAVRSMLQRYFQGMFRP